jgi:acyl-CoA thioester hydrolase
MTSSAAKFGVHKVRVYYEDTDHSQVVYHPNYLKYFERAREHLLGPELLVDLWNNTGVGFAVTRTEMTFKASLAPQREAADVCTCARAPRACVQEGARFGDVLDIRTTPEINSKYRITFDQQVWREGGAKALVLGKVEMVCLDKQSKLVPLPDVVLEQLRCLLLSLPQLSTSGLTWRVQDEPRVWHQGCVLNSVLQM